MQDSSESAGGDVFETSEDCSITVVKSGMDNIAAMALAVLESR